MRSLYKPFLLALLLVAAAPAAPEITLTPSTLTFDAPEGGAAPAPQTLTVQNTGDGRLKWTASSNAAWLTVGQLSGGLNKNESIGLSVTANQAGLAAGTYNGTITISDPAASNNPKTCTVTLHVNATPSIGVNPTSLSWTAPQNGPNPAGKPVTIQNTGTGTLAWSAGFNVPWLSASATSGNLTAGASQTVTLSVDVLSLAPGPYSGTMTITAPGAPNSPQTVTVSLTVSAAPVIGLSPTTLTFDAPQGGANPSPKPITLSNDGGGTLAWTGTTDAAWLSVSPTSGSLAGGASQPLSVTVNTSGLTEGTYLAAVHIAATGATNTPAAVAVTLNINALPKIGINPAALSFTAAIDEGQSPPAGVSVTNTGSGTLVWSASGGASWLNISPGAGSLAALASQPMFLSVNAAGMTPGHYTTEVQVSDPGAINSPQTIAIDLTVTDSDLPTHAPVGQCGLLGLEALLALSVAEGVRLLLRKWKGGPPCCP